MSEENFEKVIEEELKEEDQEQEDIVVMLHEISLPISQLFKYSLQHITATTFVCTNAFPLSAIQLQLFYYSFQTWNGNSWYKCGAFAAVLKLPTTNSLTMLAFYDISKQSYVNSLTYDYMNESLHLHYFAMKNPNSIYK